MQEPVHYFIQDQVFRSDFVLKLCLNFDIVFLFDVLTIRSIAVIVSVFLDEAN